MVVLSLFDGISCGRLVLHNLGIKIDKYYSFEIDKNAIQISRNNCKDIKQCGDVNFHKWHKLPKIDLLIAGSPCQGFSTLGKGENFKHKESNLFFKFVECLEYYKPKYFLLENVRMKKEWKDKITSYVGVAPLQLNSKDFSAQNRIREYWANFKINSVKKQSKQIIFDILDDQKDWGKIQGIFTIFENKRKYINSAYLSRQRILFTNSAKPMFLGKANFKLGRFLDSTGIMSILHKSYAITKDVRKRIALDSKHYRFLTCTELERLQGLPANYTSCVPTTQRCVTIGNGWNISTVEHILKILQ